MNLRNALTAALLSLLAPAALAQTTVSPTEPHLTAQGHAEIKTKADVANLTISVKVATRSKTVAVQQNAARTAALIAKIRTIPGIKSEDIQTVDYTITRQFSDNAVPVFLGYQVVNTVSVTLHNVRDVGRLIDLTAGGGATQITELTYSLADKSAAERQVLTLAVADARTRAGTMASALGMALGRLRLVTDSRAVVYDSNGLDGTADFAPRHSSASASTPISAQYITVRADAGVDYSLAP